MELLKGVRNDVASQIRRMPDFVIQNPESKKVYFVEVKFRATGELLFKDLSRNYLGSRKEFDLQKEVIIDFCNFAVQFFERV